MRKTIIIMSLLSGMLVSCVGDRGTTSVGNPLPSTNKSVVTFGKLQGGKVSVTVPTLFIGETTEDLKNTVIEVFLRGASSKITASDYFSEQSKAIIFDVNSTTVKDVLAISIQKKNTRNLIFTSAVSDKVDQEKSELNCSTTTNAMALLVCAICDRTNSCEPQLSESSCLAGLISSTQMQLGDEFGLPEEENSVSTQGIIDGLESGNYNANAAPLTQCITDIGALACDEVATGYDINEPGNFENIENFIPETAGSCPNVFE